MNIFSHIRVIYYKSNPCLYIDRYHTHTHTHKHTHTETHKRTYSIPDILIQNMASITFVPRPTPIKIDAQDAESKTFQGFEQDNKDIIEWLNTSMKK